jgi:hypothetical protein
LGQALARRFPEIPKIRSYFAELVDDYRRVRELRVGSSRAISVVFPLPRNPLTTFTGVVIG